MKCTRVSLSKSPESTFTSKEVLVVVKTYPRPSVKYREIVCVAGITRKGDWIRLYPIDFRYLIFLKKFSKYQWIRLQVTRNWDDYRIESYRPDLKTLQLVGKKLPAGKWNERKKIVLPTVSSCFEDLKEGYKKSGVSLGIFKPKKITKFAIKEDKKEWSVKHQEILTQLTLFGRQTKPLEKMPYKFSYKFLCNNNNCNGHEMQIIDWEIYALYRNLKHNYRYSMDIVLQKIKQKWFYDMWNEKRDSYLIVGSIFPYPTFIVLGVFWPPKGK